MAEVDYAALATSISEGARLDGELADAARASGPALAGADPRAAICALWKKIRDAVVWVSNFPLVPGNIRAVLKQLIALLDALC